MFDCTELQPVQPEPAFDQMQEEREITGNIRDESREHCVQNIGRLPA